MSMRHANLSCRPRIVSSIDQRQTAFGLKMACSLPRVRLGMYHFELAIMYFCTFDGRFIVFMTVFKVQENQAREQHDSSGSFHQLIWLS